ncbi:hypothetical protein HX902_03560 [Rhizobium sp. WYCCWR 11317]|uniref:Uncharacterized protein n=1 Tax=Rhizobium changzhiense TaxID=2692317 RepID=A0ABR6A265_9HYPH|nr:hypothetical protein [Rhizobium changzhiense]
MSLIFAAPASQGLACGYDNPQSVSRGFLNWIYPDSLYVIGAISREVAARRLPLSNFDRGGPADLFGHNFLLAKTSLEQFGTMLDVASPEPLQTSVALVLVEPMLWARFQPAPEGVRTAVHVSGAERGDLVVITGEAVIAEIAAQRLTLSEAYARGVVRVYGSDARIVEFLRTYGPIGANASAHDAKAKLSVAPARISADVACRHRLTQIEGCFPSVRKTDQ